MELKLNTVIIPQITRRVWSGVYISGTGSVLSYLTQKDRLSNLHLFTESVTAALPPCIINQICVFTLLLISLKLYF